MIRELLAVGAGGAAGSIVRHLLCSRAAAGALLWGFPAGTFAVNIAGSLLIGVLLAVLENRTAIWLLVAGFCGGFTTFSSFSADAVRLLRAGDGAAAAAYVALSVVLCLTATAAGMWIGTTLKN